MDPATKMTMGADFPALLTLSELDRLLATLSASERAEVSWSRPALVEAFDGLIIGPLNRETLDAATRVVVRVMLGMRRVLQRVTSAGGLPSLTFSAIVSIRRHRLVTFLGSETPMTHVELVAKVIAAFFERFRSDPPRMFAKLDESDRDIDSSLEQALQSPAGSLLRTEALFMAVLEAVDRNGSPERGRELARLALVAAVDFVAGCRSLGITIPLEDPGHPIEDEDEVLAVMAERALWGPPDEAARAGQWVRARMPEPAAAEAPRRRTRLSRYVGEVANVQLLRDAAVALMVSDGTLKWFTATPELVERACVLRGAPVEVLAVKTSGGPETAGSRSLTGNLVRIDPASGEQAPDSATRSRDMLRDWDELLHRLAR